MRRPTDTSPTKFATTYSACLLHERTSGDVAWIRIARHVNVSFIWQSVCRQTRSPTWREVTTTTSRRHIPRCPSANTHLLRWPGAAINPQRRHGTPTQLPAAADRCVLPAHTPVCVQSPKPLRVPASRARASAAALDGGAGRAAAAWERGAQSEEGLLGGDLGHNGCVSR